MAASYRDAARGVTLPSAGIVRHYNHRMVTLSPIGVVRSGRTAPEDDYWGEAGATIELGPDVPAEALDGIDDYSHAEIFFILDRVGEAETERLERHPRGGSARALCAPSTRKHGLAARRDLRAARQGPAQPAGGDDRPYPAAGRTRAACRRPRRDPRHAGPRPQSGTVAVPAARR